jgi:hypothetical protein
LRVIKWTITHIDILNGAVTILMTRFGLLAFSDTLGKAPAGISMGALFFIQSSVTVLVN